MQNPNASVAHVLLILAAFLRSCPPHTRYLHAIPDMSLDSGSEASTAGDTSTRQFPETETGPMAESDLPREFTVTPKKVITYQKPKKYRQQESKRRQTILAANNTSEPDDESEDEQATRDDGPAAPTRSAERLQPSSATRRQAKPSARTATRKPVAKGVPAAGSDGSDLTDIGENNVGKEAGEAASSQREQRRFTRNALAYPSFV